MSINTTRVPISDQFTRAQPFERVLVILWFVVTFTVFDYDELVLYPLAIYFFYSFFRHREETFPIMMMCWPLLLLPVWAVITSPFAVVPSTALRSAIQMILTMQVCILLVIWLRPREVILTVLIATGICAILSLLFNRIIEGGWAGIFAHKNMLGAKMLLLWSAALCVALDPWMKLGTRIVALCLAFLALFLILASNSATALVLSLAIVGVIVSLNFFAGEGAKTPIDRTAMGLVVFGTLGLVTAFAFLITDTSPIAMVLEMLGKSGTLTGRTDLWDYARDVIRDHPYLGHGEGGFWRYEENELVQQIFAEFHKSPRQVFTFHNSFLEIGVHFGMIGLGLALFTIAWAVFLVFKQLIIRGGMPFLFFPTVTVIELTRSYVESELMRPFVLSHMLIWIGAAFVAKYPFRTESAEPAKRRLKPRRIKSVRA